MDLTQLTQPLADYLHLLISMLSGDVAVIEKFSGLGSISPEIILYYIIGAAFSHVIVTRNRFLRMNLPWLPTPDNSGYTDAEFKGGASMSSLLAVIPMSVLIYWLVLAQGLIFEYSHGDLHDAINGALLYSSLISPLLAIVSRQTDIHKKILARTATDAWKFSGFFLALSSLLAAAFAIWLYVIYMIMLDLEIWFAIGPLLISALLSLWLTLSIGMIIDGHAKSVADGFSETAEARELTEAIRDALNPEIIKSHQGRSPRYDLAFSIVRTETNRLGTEVGDPRSTTSSQVDLSSSSDDERP